MSYHKRILEKFLYTLIIIFLLTPAVFSQNISLNNGFLIDYLRNKQLADSSKPNRSFCIRPLSFDNNIQNIDLTKKITKDISVLPFSLIMQTNTHHPFGWNDGAMIPAKGFQTLISGGLYFKKGNFSAQIQPEFVYAANPGFETFPTEYASVVWAAYYKWENKIDNPERYGTDSYHKFFLGQSSVYYHKKGIAIGISSENIWWGPSIDNSLIMSNNAPGFLHATIHTEKPIQTKAGSFEFQLIGGQLKSSNITPLDTNKVYNGAFLYEPKVNCSRYINGVVVSWQPKWLKGLFVGFSNTAYLYRTDVKSIADIFPIQFIRTSAWKNHKKSIQGNIFVRYVMPEENAEIYAEYGRSDRAANITNLIADKDYPRGYVVGLRKLSNVMANKSRFEFTAEIAQLELPAIKLVDEAASWYTHDYVRQGYTNLGQVLGAGIGPGSQSQMIDISWLTETNKVGLKLERIVRNNDLYYGMFMQSGYWQRHWVDLYAALHTYWKLKSFYINAEMGLSRTLNYEWWVTDGSDYFTNGYDFLNFHGQINLVYKFW